MKVIVYLHGEVALNGESVDHVKAMVKKLYPGMQPEYFINEDKPLRKIRVIGICENSRHPILEGDSYIIHEGKMFLEDYTDLQ